MVCKQHIKFRSSMDHWCVYSFRQIFNGCARFSLDKNNKINSEFRCVYICLRFYDFSTNIQIGAKLYVTHIHTTFLLGHSPLITCFWLFYFTFVLSDCNKMTINILWSCFQFMNLNIKLVTSEREKQWPQNIVHTEKQS